MRYMEPTTDDHAAVRRERERVRQGVAKLRKVSRHLVGIEDVLLERWIICPRSWLFGCEPHAPQLTKRATLFTYCERCMMMVMWRDRRRLADPGAEGLTAEQLPIALAAVRAAKARMAEEALDGA